MRCSNCNSIIDPRTAWKSTSNFYCSEFCADAGVECTLNPAYRLSKDEIDRQYIERLRKLLPYVRRTAGPASPSS